MQVCRLQIIGGPEFGRLFADVAAGSAQRAIFKAIELDPTDGYAWVLRAHLLNDMHRSADAKLALIEAEKLGADSAWLALNWAEVYEAEGNIERAAKKYQEVVGNAGAKKAALNRALQQLTIYHVARHEWERAEQAYREAVAINLGGAWLRTKYADALMRHGQFSKAISYARESLQIKDYAATRHVLAIALYGVWANAVVNAENRERAQVFYDEAHALVSDLKAVAVEANQLAETRIITQALIQEGLVAKTDVFRRPE
jgi:tetratricopeptide (TPR) repeat protein